MNKLFISFFLIFITQNAMAQFKVINRTNATIGKSTSAPSSNCHDCRTDDSHTSDRITFTTKRRDDGLPHFNTACVGFIKSDGTYGEWGTIIQDYIVAKGGASSRFFSNGLPGMETDPRTCPRWGQLTEQEKMKFWVWTMASIAQVESSCNTRSVNLGSVPNPSDRPRGLFQLNTLKANRSWRGPNCKFPSGAENVYNAKNSILCSLDIMDELLKGRAGEYKSNGKIFPTNSYWEKLRSNHSNNGGPIGKLVRQYGPCQATP